MDQTTLTTELILLQKQVEEFKEIYLQNLDFSGKVNSNWSAKDVLGHITFWHESFAKNVKNLVEKGETTPLKGKLSEVNHQSVESTREVNITELLQRLDTAQTVINENILSSKITMIPYRKGSRDYSALEHLKIVRAHIKKHLNSIQNAFSQ